MASYKAFWYTDDGHLVHLGRHHLKELLKTYEPQLRAHGIVVEEPERDDDYYKRLAAVFLRPEGIPKELHEALYYIKGLDSDNGLNRIAQAVKAGRLVIDMAEDSSTADKALQAWLQDAELVRNLHIEVGLDAGKSFTHFKPLRRTVPPMADFRTAKGPFEKELAAVFKEHGRGAVCEIEVHCRNGESVFIVRHGAPYRRDTEYRNAAAAPLYYWPGVLDLIVYDPGAQTLRMNVQPSWLRKVYAQHFGRHFFGDAGLFAEGEVFTLQPLRELGRRALEGAVYGIEEIALVELQTVADEALDDVRVRRSKDVFTSYEREKGLPADEELKQASFRIRFEGARSHRTVTVSGNRARYTQDHNGRRVTKWLRGSGFVIGENIEVGSLEEGEDADGLV